jgi:hypothetical protein
MAFETFASCEREGCNSRVQVPSVGNLPSGWIIIRYAKVHLNQGQPVPEPANGIFCSWKCALHFVKSFIEERAEVQKVSSRRKVAA